MICRSFAALRPYTNRVRRAITDGFLPESGCIPNLGEEFADLLVQNDSQQRLIDLNFAVVFDEAQFPEFVHEKIHA
jgi:hypothetical protein